MLTLVADRFVHDEHGRVLDLATGDPVTLVETTVAARADHLARHERCVALLGGTSDRTSEVAIGSTRVSSLIDFALVGQSQWIEAHRMIDTTDAAIADTTGGEASTSHPRTTVNHWARVLDGVLAALDGLRASDLRRLYVKTSGGPAFESFLATVAREARARGIVPVCPAAIEKWPVIVTLLRLRSIVLLGPCDDEHGPVAAHTFARALATLTRAAVSIVAIVLRVAECAAVAALTLKSSRVSPSSHSDDPASAGFRFDSIAPAHVLRVAEPVAAYGGGSESGSGLRLGADRDAGANPRAIAGDVGRAYPMDPQDSNRRRVAYRWPPRSRLSRASGASRQADMADIARSNRHGSGHSHIEEPAMEGLSRSPGGHDPESHDGDIKHESIEPFVVTTMMSGYSEAADALVRRGRWAAASRVLRTELASYDRRDAPNEAARTALALGRLFLALADTANAVRWLDHAGERASRAGHAWLVADVLHWSGIAAMDRADLEQSERLLRTALAAAGPAADPHQTLAIELTIARCLFWQGRFDEIVLPAIDRLPSVGSQDRIDGGRNAIAPPSIQRPQTAASATAIAARAPHRAHVPGSAEILRVTYWRRVARLAIVQGSLSRAGDALARACRLARGDDEGDVRRGACHVDRASVRASSRAVLSRVSTSASRIPSASSSPAMGASRQRQVVTRGYGSARDGAYGAAADLQVACHLDAARLQLALGDWTGCDVHLRECLALARAPARTRRIQALQIARLRGDRRAESRRQVERLAAALRQPHVPPLVRIRARYLVEPRSRRAGELTTFVARHGEAALMGRAAGGVGGGGSPMLDAFQAVLQICHETPDDLTALARVCAFLRERLQAACVAVHGAPLERGRLAVAGSLRLTSPDLAARAIDNGLMIPPTYRADALDAAAPIRYAGHTIGALVVRWIIDATVDHPSASALLGAASAALAPHVRSALDRDRPEAAASASSPVRTLGLLGMSAAMDSLRQTIGRVAAAPFHVLIEGESGSGKELVARALHQHGPRRHRRFCAVNCAALTDELLEAELFGHTRGAFTGALTERAGLFEEADNGTLFLDEIGELSARGQAKLLRVIQDGETRRIGENLPRRVDARIVAATNRSLHDEAAAGHFRADLLYRLDVIRIVVPPLRARLEDVPVLARAFWDEATARTGSRATLDPDTLAALARYHWPGNVRELHNAVMALAVHAPARGRVLPSLLPATIRTRGRSAGAISGLAPGEQSGSIDIVAEPGLATLDAARRAFETRFVQAALLRAGGRQSRAARELGLTREGLRKLIARLGLNTADGRAHPRAADVELAADGDDTPRLP